MNDLEEVEAGDEGRTYREKSYWARLRVVLAGPAMNLLIGFLVLVLTFSAIGVASDRGWRVGDALAGSAAATAGLRHGDELVSIDGKPVAGWNSFGDVIKKRMSDTVHLVVLRDGRRVPLTATLGWDLTDQGANKLQPLIGGDLITKVGDTKVATYGEARDALAAAPKGTTTILFSRDGDLYRTQVHTPVTLTAKDAQGLLGITASPRTVRESPVGAVADASRQFGSLVTGSVAAIGHFFSPSGLTRWTQYVFTQNDNGTSASSTAPVVPVQQGTPAATQPLSSSSPENNRIISMIGVLRLGSEAGSAGLADVLILLALINVFLGLINLVPLPPFDGGHAAVATYEAIRGKLAGRPYRADMAKLIPVTYAVLVLMVLIFVSSSYLDLVHPAQNPFGRP
jgi:membrane-associated protease RseP (regulator of RpoE activity)